jgi:L-fucose mutarotase/ribose pyranase (RbsD/FucU family)
MLKDVEPVLTLDTLITLTMMGHLDEVAVQAHTTGRSSLCAALRA